MFNYVAAIKIIIKYTMQKTLKKYILSLTRQKGTCIKQNLLKK